MNETDIQLQSDHGDEHRDDVTVAQAIAAIRRCEFVRYDATGDDELGPEHHITPVSIGRLNADWATDEVIEAVRKADRIWWQGDRLQFTTDHRTLRLPQVYPQNTALCMYCAKYVHSGPCVVEDAPNYRPGMSA